MKQLVTKVKKHYLLLAILSVSVFLRLYNIDFQSIWLDEIHTMIESDPDLTFQEFHEVMMAREGMGHLYFLILKYLYYIFGYSPFTARLFSAVVGVLSVYWMYRIGKVLSSKNTGLIAALLLTVNFFHISYSQEARPYVLLLLFTIISYYYLILFIKTHALKNAVLTGVFSGLIVNAHFVGIITVASQSLLLLGALFVLEKEQRILFFKRSLHSGWIALLVMSPTTPLFLKMMEYKSGWLLPPGPDGLTTIFKLFLGNTELLYFIFSLLIIYFLVQLFQQNNVRPQLSDIVDNKLVFSTIILFNWMFLSILLPVVKTYLSEPMILHRYFIGLLPALILIIAIGADMIKNNMVKVTLLVVIFSFSVVDICVVKKYYTTATKSQFREVTQEILDKKKDTDKFVSSFGWLMRYFLNQDNKNELTIERNLDDYVTAMRNKSILMESFWYLDGNSRPYSLSTENQQFLEEHFRLAENIEKYDAWAKYYVSKAPQQASNGSKINMSSFEPLVLDDYGNLMFFWNSTSTALVNLESGQYRLTINGLSMPSPPIQGENAHIIIMIDDQEVANYFLSDQSNTTEKQFEFYNKSSKQAKLKITFDNDIGIDGKDRNAMIYSIQMDKIK